ncbi:MAG: PepSY domain-containing protein [Pyrinomonadaceae bacterium]
MKARKLHRVIGIILLLPFFAWALTGLVFFIKPGYEGAYEVLSPRTYPLERPLTINPDPAWLEFRCFKTVLGEHLLVRTGAGWSHLNPADGRPRDKPAEEQLRALLKDAFSANPRRYGNVASVSGDTAKTDTGVEVTVDWDRLSLQQRGRDTDRIDLLYKVHYLQWTGVPVIDKAVGISGIVLVLALTVLGARLALQRS